MSVHVLSAREPRPAAPVYLVPPHLVVTRTPAASDNATCSLCWTGPVAVAGLVRERHSPTTWARPLCRRCLVTLEMLGAQFGPDLRLQVDAPA